MGSDFIIEFFPKSTSPATTENDKAWGQVFIVDTKSSSLISLTGWIGWLASWPRQVEVKAEAEGGKDEMEIQIGTIAWTATFPPVFA